MGKWRDEITLITLLPPTKDDDGFVLPQAEQNRIVFCSIISAGQGEFYKAAQAGIRVECKCEVYTADYNGETLCEINGKRYEILRTFSPNNGDFTELTLTDIRQPKAAADG